ncbi:MAG: cadherin domain-containing protein [Fibrobacterales bacterium]
MDYTFGGTAVSGVGNDYTTSTTTVTIPAGAPWVNLIFSAWDDTEVEPYETVTVTINSVTGASEFGGVGAQDLTFEVESNDATTLTIIPRNSGINEVSGQTYVIAELDNITYQDVVVTFAYAGTATDPNDYTLDLGDANDGMQVTIPAGSLKDSIRVNLVDNVLWELAETVQVSVASVTNAMDGSVLRTITIFDNEVMPQYTVDADTTVQEDVGTAEVTFSITQAAEMDITIYFRTAGTATVGAGNDYTVGGSPIVIPATALSVDLPFTIIDNAILESNQYVNVFIDSSDLANKGADTLAVLTIQDNDAAPAVTLSGDLSMLESGDSAIVTATIASATEVTSTITLAAAGVDSIPVQYSLSSTTITILPGSTTGSITVYPVDNDDDAVDADVDIEIVGVVNCIEVVPQSHEVVITDDDVPLAAITAIETIAIDSMIESGGNVTVQVNLDRYSWQDVTITMGYSGTAIKNVDFSTTTDVIVIAAGDSTGYFTLTGISDPFDEDQREIIGVEIASVINGLEDSTQLDSVYILDDDATPQVSFDINSQSIAESVGSLSALLNVSAISNRDITVYYSLSGTASDGVDLNVTPNPLVISAGDVVDSLDISITDDFFDESDEYFIFTIDSLQHALNGTPNQHTVTILDNDTANVILTLDKANIPENGGTAMLSAAITIGGNQNVNVFLNYGGVAAWGVDFTADTVITIPTGQLSASIPIIAIDDGAADAIDENIDITIDSVQNGADASTVQTVTIVDAITPKVTVTLDKSSMSEENDSIQYTATIDVVSAQDVVFDLIFSGTAEDLVDYVMTHTVTVPAGMISQTVSILPIADTDDEQNETLTIDIDSTTMVNGEESGGVGSEGKIISIIDNDIPVVSLISANNPLFENGGEATVTAVLSGASWQPITVNLSFAGTALYTSDYIRSDSIIVIAPGAFSNSITIIGINDPYDEFDETVLVDMASVINAVPDSFQLQTVGIVDDDVTPTVTFILDRDTLREDSLDVATLVAVLSDTSGRNVDLTVSVGGSAIEGAMFDYLGSDVLFEIPMGKVRDSITFTSVFDAVNEVHEIITFATDTIINALDGTTADTIVIFDDDKPKVTLTLLQDSLRENQSDTLLQYDSVLVVQAALSILSFQDVTIELDLSGVADSMDYQTSTTSIFIPSGSSQGFAYITILDDEDCEANESLVVGITSLINGKENGGTGAQVKTAFIVNDDDNPGVSLVADTNSVTENGGVATITARLTARTWQNVVVTLDNTLSTAIAGTDYTLGSSTITIPAGDLSGFTTITGVDDSDDLADVMVALEMVSATNAIEHTAQMVQVTLKGDDTPIVTLAIDSTSIDELGGVSQASVTIQRTSWQDIIVYFGFENHQGRAAWGSDFSSVDSIIIPAGVLSVPFTVEAIDDFSDESDEIVGIFIDTVVNALEDGVQLVSMLIIDDEAAPLVNDTTLYLFEGGAIGSSIGTLFASDANGDTLFFDILNSEDVPYIGIDSMSGALYVIDPTNIDFETAVSHQLLVRVSDRVTDNLPTAIVRVEILNVNDNPPLLELEQFYISENASADTVFGQLSALDPDGGSVLYTVLSGNERGFFTISTSGEIALLSPDSINYDIQSEYLVTVQVADSGFSVGDTVVYYDTNTVVISIEDYNFPPTIANNPSDSLWIIQAYSEVGTEVGRVTGSDSDSNTVFTYEIIEGNNAGKFAIHPDSGFVKVVSILEPGEQFYLIMGAVDQGGAEAARAFAIIVEGVNDSIDYDLSGAPDDTVAPIENDSIAPPPMGPVVDVDPIAGTTTEQYLDGRTIVYYSDGSKINTDSDGTQKLVLKNGCTQLLRTSGAPVDEPLNCPETAGFHSGADSHFSGGYVVRYQTGALKIKVPMRINNVELYSLTGARIGSYTNGNDGYLHLRRPLRPGVYLLKEVQ